MPGWEQLAVRFGWPALKRLWPGAKKAAQAATADGGGDVLSALREALAPASVPPEVWADPEYVAALKLAIDAKAQMARVQIKKR